MKKIINLIDFFVGRNNSPPLHNNKQKLFLKSHEKAFGSGDVNSLFNKKINQKNYLVMKKSGLILVFLIFNSLLFAQPTMRINGELIGTDPYVENICSGSNLQLTISIFPSTTQVDSIRVFEYVSTDNCNSYGTPAKRVGPDLVWLVPESGSAQPGACYKYLIQVYYNGTGQKISGLCRINVIDPPNAQLSASTSTICTGETVVFTASGGSNYEFKINGETKQNGSSNLFSTNLLNNDDIVVVDVSENGCSATSTPITMTVNPLPDLTSLTPHLTCNGADMRFDYQGLTGTGPWTLSFWDPAHNTQYGVDFNVTNPNGSLDVPINYGTSNVHLKIRDQHCANF